MANWTRRVSYASFWGDECDDIAIHQPSGQRDKSVPVAAHAELYKRIHS